MKKDTNFYDKESRGYSKKRYPDVDTEYLHFFFKKRLGTLLSYIDFISKDKTGMNLLEIGCADGVVMEAISSHSKSFSSLLGIDVSPKMIEVAKYEVQGSNVSFSLREGKAFGLYDVIVEVGVLNMVDLAEELIFVKKHLKNGGYYICSIASGSSLRARIKSRRGEDGFSHFRRFEEYDFELKGNFKVLKSMYYGLFVPLLWKVPFVARITQPFFEDLFQCFAKSLFHEKIYLLRND